MNLASNAELCGAPAVLKENFAEYLRRFGEPGGAAKLVFRKAAGFPHRDAYRVEFAPDAVTVTAGTDEGLFYGAWEVLAQMETGFAAGTVERAPVCDLRGVKIYLPEPTEQGMANFRRLVDLMCRYRYNYLMIELGGAMEYKRHPEINEGWIEYSNFMNEYSGKPQKIQNSFAWHKNSIHTTNGGGRVVPQTMIREMIDYCRARYIEVVPEEPSLSHCDYLLTRHHELAERQDDPYPDTVCPLHPDYYPLLFDLFDEIIELFRPKRMHLGHDEYYSVAHCPRCKHLSAPQIYADDLNKCREYLKSRGVDMMIWSEKLLDSHFPSGRGCGGALIYSREPGHENEVMVPAIWPSIDMIPNDIQCMHWYWSIDRKLEEAYTERGFPVMFGNLRSVMFPEWERRIREPNVVGTCCSNWGATDPGTLQRNGILFEIAYTSLLHWGAPSGEFAKLRDEAFASLYRLHGVLDGPGRYMEVTHRTSAAQPYHTFVDGYFLDEAKDVLGHHIFRAADGSECRFPVIYGSNVPSGAVSLDRDDSAVFQKSVDADLDGARDAYKVDIQFCETAFRAFPERHGDAVAARTRYRLPDDGKRYTYAGFEPVPGFDGKVELLASREVVQR